jgi:DNA-binding response OmpR family regulator
MEQRILIVEDDPDIGALLRLHLSYLCSEVRVERHGARGLILARSLRWDLIVLDWLLPGTDGVQICRLLRTAGRSLPVLLLTARSTEFDRVMGLDSGADDYVSKPFSIHELTARVRAQLRRAAAMRMDQAPLCDSVQVQHGVLRIDPAARSVTVKDSPISLTSREFDLLLYFARHPGRVFTRVQLLTAVWGDGYEGYEHTVNSHINRLRAKLEPDPATPIAVVTVWGTGYRFDPRGMQ